MGSEEVSVDKHLEVAEAFAIRITSHEDVKDYFRTYPELARIKVPYDTLKQVSHSVRYYGELERPDSDFTRALSMTRQIRAWALPKIKAA
ncbi:MAG: hypothetical protein FWD69_06500 [Polyangiaceae bacterium]|nr:hypothetical protein [Polyangiaceae bacterium]